jgi:hypothetical protein
MTSFNYDRNTRPYLYLFFSLSFLIYFYLALSQFTSTKYTLFFPDSTEYKTVASLPFISHDFWVGKRAPILPLFLKLIGHSTNKLIWIQFFLHLFSWSALAWVTSGQLVNKYLKVIAWLGILLLSCLDRVVLWNRLVLSESISLSSFIFFIACMSHQLQKTKNWKFILTVTFGFLFALSRDSNAYLVFFISLPLLLISKQRQLGLVLIIIAFSGFWSNHISQRWVPAFYNVISYRIIPKPSHLLFFEKNGMPVTKALMKREKKPYWSDNNAYSENSDLENFWQWAQKSGKTTYVKFLITHPIYLFLSPIKNISGMLSDRMSRYKTKSTPSGFNNNIFDFKITTYFYLLVLFGSIISLFFLRNKYKNQFLLIKMSLAIIILTFPTILIIWHADPLALNRHGLNVAIQFRLGLLISLVAGLDAILLKGKNGRLANQQ